MCKQLGISHAAYYKWLHRTIPEQESENTKLAVYTKSEFSKMFDTSGLVRRSFTFCVNPVGMPPHLRKRFQISTE